MRCLLDLLVPGMVLVACVTVLAQEPVYRLGRSPSQEEIRAWDISIGPEGRELPPGRGTAKESAKIFAVKCAGCHGPTGAEGPATRLSGLNPGMSLWPVATAIWDYINRCMPLYQEGSLSADEVYALTALMLYWSGIIQESDVVDANSLPKVQMPNRNRFIPPRPEWKPGVPRLPYGIYP